MTFVTEIASNNGIRRLRFRLWENYLHNVFVSSLHVFCIPCNFLDSYVQILCKFLAKSLQEFGAGGGKRGKTDPTLAPKSIQNRTNLAQGVGKGYPEININIKKIEKTQTQTQQLEQKKIYIYIFYVRRFPQKTEGSTAGRLPMFFFFEKKKTDKNVV